MLLGRTVKERLQRQATNIEMAAYLSNDLEVPRSGARTSFWAQVRASVIRLKKKLGLKWRWCSEQETFHLDCGDGAAFSVSPGQKHQATAMLRKCLVEHYAGTLLGKKDQGKSFEVIRKSKVSNHFLRSGRNTRFCDWRFIHRARLNVLPVNATLRWLTEADKRCRRCGAPSETLPHVLNHCTVHSAARQRRHNEVQDRLVKACARNPCPIRVNHSVQGIHGTLAALRPDIVLRDEIHRRVHIVDVCIPFENRLVAFTEAREEKRTKYAALAEQLRGQGYTVDVDAFVVGALGGWDGRNEAVLNRLGVSSRYAAMMRRFMVSDTIRWGQSLECELCPAAQRELPLRNGSRYGVFTGESRKSQLAKHLKLRHSIAADKIRAGCKMCGYVSMGKYSLKDVRAHIKREHEAGQAEPVRARGAARAARPNRCRDNNNNNINNNNTGGSGESVNSISSQNDRATAAEILGTNHGAAPSGSAQNRREEEDGPEEDSPGPTITRTRRAARQRLPSMSDTDEDSINTSIHEQQQQHQLARNNLSVSPDVQRHQHVTTRTQAATATSPDSGSVTPPPTPLSSRVTNANVSHSPESPRRTLRPRAAATQQPRLQTTSRACVQRQCLPRARAANDNSGCPKGLSSRPKRVGRRSQVHYLNCDPESGTVDDIETAT
ncbi:unnamed protein product [Trichogramma brassicae]|uniref:Uncharacterized protein n=1 Tax=Trichogramma brassicae TaxID=86971 RepID=A0A6H5HVT0_9HYME|nr:unnamed protein product [Trichogramma brassicae]